MKAACCVNSGIEVIVHGMQKTLPSGPEAQSAAAVLMVRPAHFGCNPQTAASNTFQHPADPSGAAQNQPAALREFERAADILRRAGVEVLVAADTPSPVKPDAVFPNNWLSFHRDGTVVLYPMLAQNRRLERRYEILEQVVREGGRHISRTVDLTHREAEGKFLEGTGSVVLDRIHRVAYACCSPRTDLDVLGEFAQILDYAIVSFDALNEEGLPIYHTNVLMAIGAGFAVVCAEAIVAPHRQAVLGKLRATGREVVDISRRQMLCFAGNVLELQPPAGNILALSETALRSLEPRQRKALEKYANLVPMAIPTIEHLGGGAVRCMLAEIHLPKRE